jgi:hypothetical protein
LPPYVTSHCTCCNTYTHKKPKKKHRYQRKTRELLPAAPARLYELIGVQGMAQLDWVSAQEWLETALEAMPAPDAAGDDVRLRASVTERLIWCAYKTGNLSDAIQRAEQV